MKRETIGIAALLFAVAAALSAVADTHVPGGFVSGTWNAAGSPYILDGNVVIHQDSTLVIEPGVNVLMDPGRRFRCEGQLLAVGTQQDSIRFIATNTTEGSKGVDFLNTNLSPRDSSKLVYCEIKYGTASPYPDPYMHGGGLYIKNSSRLLVSHCTISHCRTRNVIGANGANGQPGWPYGGAGSTGEAAQSGHGGAIYCEGSSPAITFCLLAYNRTGDARGGHGGDGGAASSPFGSAYGGDGAAGGSGQAGHGGAVCLINSAAIISGNIMIGNFTGSGSGGEGGHGGSATVYGEEEPPYPYAIGGDGGGGGGGYAGQGGSVWMENSAGTILTNNLIVQNRAGAGRGGAGGQGGNATGIWGWSIHIAGAGGQGGDGLGGDGYAIYIFDGSPAITSCTIAQHTQLSAGRGGQGGLNGSGMVYAPSGVGRNGTNIVYGSATISNCITWGNANPTISGSAIVSYSCIQGGFPGTGNISSDPLFVSPALENYCLSQIASGQTQQSPAVDAGNPGSPMILGSTRTDGVQDSGVVDMGYHYPLGTPQSQIALTLTPHNPLIVIPPSGGSFRFDISISYSQPPTIDFWIVITLPDSTPQTSFLRENITLPPSGIVFRPNLTQYIPAAAPPGSYLYTGHIRDHETWEELDSDSFSFTKLPGEDSPAHDFGWNLLGWDEDVAAGEPFPTEIRLLGNYPNPFNASTAISYQLSAFSQVSLKVYDTAGRLVATLVDGWRDAGVHDLTWDASGLTSGMYFYRLQANGHSEVKKMILVK